MLPIPTAIKIKRRTKITITVFNSIAPNFHRFIIFKNSEFLAKKEFYCRGVEVVGSIPIIFGSDWKISLAISSLPLLMIIFSLS
jgi:uncharacterized membrane protein